MPSPAERRACELLVASHVVRALAERRVDSPSAEELIEDANLRTCELSLLGLTSLDWIALATRLEDATGAEIPDQVLLRPEYRCVAGWSEAILAAGAPKPEAHQPTH